MTPTDPAYTGPGAYKHYKGGTYQALGLGEVEFDQMASIPAGARFVVYTSDSDEHTRARAARNVDFVLRPLNPVDGPDAWNSRLLLPIGSPVPGGQRALELAARFERCPTQPPREATADLLAELHDLCDRARDVTRRLLQERV